MSEFFLILFSLGKTIDIIVWGAQFWVQEIFWNDKTILKAFKPFHSKMWCFAILVFYLSITVIHEDQNIGFPIYNNSITFN